MCCTLSYCIKIISLKISKSPEWKRVKTKKKLWIEIYASRSVYFIAMLRKIIQIVSMNSIISISVRDHCLWPRNLSTYYV